MKILKIIQLITMLSIVITVFLPLALIKAGDNDPVRFQPSITIPGSDFKVGQQIQVDEENKPILLVRYIQAIYKFFVGIAGILAVFMIVFGGITWIFSGGSSEKISKAKETILGAVAGLILAVGSYMVLNTVNPSLVNFQLMVQKVPGFVMPAYWCSDVEVPADFQDPKFTDLLDGSAVSQGQTICGREYKIPAISNQATGLTCHGDGDCGSGKTCGVSIRYNAQTEKDEPISLCISYQNACEIINDNNTNTFGLSDDQSACDSVNMPGIRRCIWIDKPGVSEWILGLGKTIMNDGCYYFDSTEITRTCSIAEQGQGPILDTCLKYNLKLSADLPGFSIIPFGEQIQSLLGIEAVRKAICENDLCSTIRPSGVILRCSYDNTSGCH